jgi:hypothetical protein
MADVQLSKKELELIYQALDSHVYWQLSEDKYRRDSSVMPPGSDDPEAAEEIREADELRTRLFSLLHTD